MLSARPVAQESMLFVEECAAVSLASCALGDIGKIENKTSPAPLWNFST